MDPLYHIATKVNNKAAEVWSKKGSVSSSTAVDPILRKTSWIDWQTNTHFSVSRISGTENKDAETALHLPHLPVSSLLQYFNSSFLHPNPRCLRILPCDENHRLCMMIHTKRSPQGFLIPLSERTTCNGVSGKPIVPGYAPPKSSKKSRI